MAEIPGHLPFMKRGVWGVSGLFLIAIHCSLSTHHCAELIEERTDLGLPALPDDVDLGIVGDGLEGDMRHALVDEAVADVATHRLGAGRGAGDFGFLELAVAGVGQQIERIACAHDAGPGQRQGDAGGVDGDPAPAPLLRDGGRGSRAAGRIEHEVAGVGGHEDAALNCLCHRLDDVNLLFAKTTRTCV